MRETFSESASYQLLSCHLHVQAAALKLAYMEYADLGLDERLALLQGLLEQALDCEEVRELITSKVEAMALPRQKKPVSHYHSTFTLLETLSN